MNTQHFKHSSCRTVAVLLFCLAVQSCGGGGGGSAAAQPTPTPMAVTVTFAPSSYMGTADDRDAQSAILTVSATASDQASVSYSISDGNGQGYFVIDAATGALRLAAASAADVPSGRYELTVTATAGTVSATATAVVTLGEFLSFTQDTWNASPSFRNSTDAIVTVQAQSSIGESAQAYAISAGDDSGYFKIDSSGLITFTEAGVNAPAAMYSLTVRATSSGATAGVATVLIDLSVSKILFSSASYSASVSDLSGGGTAVEVVATAPGDLTYMITGGNDNNYFAIDAMTGAISVTDNGSGGLGAGVVDLTVTVDSSDNNVASSTVQVQLTIAAVIVVAQAPVMANPAHRDSTMILARIGARLTSGAALVYAITSGNDNDYFVIDEAGGELRFSTAGVNAPLGTYTLGVNIDDGAGSAEIMPATATATIILGDFIRFEQASYSAMPAFRDTITTVVQVAAMTSGDEDIVYTITEGNASNFFKIDASTGAITLTTTGGNSAGPTPEMLAMGMLSRYTLTVSATSGQALLLNTAEVMIALGEIISVVAVNDVDITDGNFDTDAMVTTIIGILDSDAMPSYSITAGNDDGLFAIDSSSGVVTLVRLNFNLPASAITLTVTVSAPSGASAQETFDVSFDNVMASLEFTESSYAFMVSLDDPTVAPAAPIAVGDPFAVTGRGVADDASVVYTILSCTSCIFTLSASGQLMLNGAPDDPLLNAGIQLLSIRASSADGMVIETINVNVSLAPVLRFRRNSGAMAVITDRQTVSPPDSQIGASIAIDEASIIPTAADTDYMDVAYTLTSAVDEGGSDASSTFTLGTSGELMWASDATSSLYTLVIDASATPTGGGTALEHTLNLQIMVTDGVAPVLTNPSARSNTFVYSQTMAGDNIGIELAVSDNIDAASDITVAFATDGNPAITAGALAQLVGRQLSWNTQPVEADIGSHTLTLIATDSSDNVSTELVIAVEITAPNMAPRLSVVGSGGGTVGRVQTLSGLVGVRDLEFVAFNSDFHYAYVATDSGVTGYALTVGDDGAVLTLISPAVSLSITGVRDLTSSDGMLFVSAANSGTDSVRSYTVGMTGALTPVNEVTDNSTDIELDGAADMAVATIDGSTVLVVAAPDDSGLALLTVADDGTLAHAVSLDEGADSSNLELSGVSGLVVLNNFVYAASANRITIVGITRTTSPPVTFSLAYSSKLESSQAQPLGDRLGLALVSARDGDSDAYALAVASDGATKSQDGLVLIPIDTSTAAPTLTASGIIAMRDGAVDATLAFGDPTSVTTFAPGSTNSMDPDRMISLTTADQNGAFLQYLAFVATGNVWSLSPVLTELIGDNTDASYRLAGELTTRNFVRSGLSIDAIVSPDSGAVTVLQTPIVRFNDNLSSGTYSPDMPPTVAQFDILDDNVNGVSGLGGSLVTSIVGTATFKALTVSPTNDERWILRENVLTGATATLIAPSTDRYVASIPLSDISTSVRYCVLLGAYRGS
ncbi:MAG: cadherin repeat domain-containing protein [Proteobacteria bacterium]|nr:cadherin repeat domain-containing protein [Pseudomonadota bacterium]